MDHAHVSRRPTVHAAAWVTPAVLIASAAPSAVAGPDNDVTVTITGAVAGNPVSRTITTDYV